MPTVDWDRTTHNVLTMEWIDGIALNDHARLEQSHVDLPDLGRKVIQSFLRHALRDGFFHADMHPGNLFLDDAGRLVAVDFGIMGRLGLKERRFLAEILLGFITRDYRRVAEAHFEAGYVPGHHSVENFAQAIRAIGEPIHNRTAEEISMAKLLTLLLEVTGLFDMQTRPELILLQKTMVVVEGVARGFDPKLDIWKVADPVVREWIERNLGPIGRIQGAMSGAGELGRVVASLPAIAGTYRCGAGEHGKMVREGLVLSPETIAAMGRRRSAKPSKTTEPSEEEKNISPRQKKKKKKKKRTPPNAGARNRLLPRPCSATICTSAPKVRCPRRIGERETADDHGMRDVRADQQEPAEITIPGKDTADQEACPHQPQGLPPSARSQRARFAGQRERAPAQCNDEGRVTDLRRSARQQYVRVEATR